MHEMLGAELGFLDKQSERWRLESRHFPSKVGGKPAWLDLENLPQTEELACQCCGKPMMFLAQVYAPDDDDEDGRRIIKDTCYHRTIFVFTCTTADCYTKNSNRNFVVFRCQMKRHNKFYPPIDPPEDPDWKKEITVEKYCTVCIVCGCRGTKKCGGCKKYIYCTRDHQLLHWKNGHKQLCKQGIEVEGMDNCFTLPEYEIIIDDEKLEVELDAKATNLEAELREFDKIVESKKPQFQDDDTIDTCVQPVKEDAQFQRFKEKIESYPDQVLRYSKGSEPLWVSDSNQPTSIPECQLCGGPRRFEFQIMPQMLNDLRLDSASDTGIDWGTLAIYTCSDNCDLGSAYKKEYVWKQDYSD